MLWPSIKSSRLVVLPTSEYVRDRAILATLLYHGIRCEELCLLRLRDLHSRQGVMHFRVKGKRDKIRCSRWRGVRTILRHIRSRCRGWPNRSRNNKRGTRA